MKMATIKKTHIKKKGKENKHWVRTWGEKSSNTLWVGKKVQPHGTQYDVPQKTGNPVRSVMYDTMAWYRPEGDRFSTPQRYPHTHVHCGPFHNSQTPEAA